MTFDKCNTTSVSPPQMLHVRCEYTLYDLTCAGPEGLLSSCRLDVFSQLSYPIVSPAFCGTAANWERGSGGVESEREGSV